MNKKRVVKISGEAAQDIWDEANDQDIIDCSSSQMLQLDFQFLTGQLPHEGKKDHKSEQYSQQRKLYLSLMKEELKETLAAIEILEKIPNNWEATKEVLDGVIDFQVVSNGYANALGVSLFDIYKEIHINNLTKLSPETVDGVFQIVQYEHPETGKILKPDGYKKVDLDKFKPYWM